jgi:MFS family permease
MIRWSTILTNKGVMFALLTNFFGTCFLTFNSGYMPTQLASMGFGEDNVGFVLGAQSFVYLVTCLLLPYTCEAIPRKLMFVVAIFGMSICMFMMGPS